MAAPEQHGGKVRCYYELLEVGRQATEDELKKAYRRLALRWHPDKNPDRVEEATAHFRLVQKAYETLSDPQERAWYDKHRERILKGGLGRGDAYQEERLDVFQYFTSSCYDDYNDEPEGYFTVYAKVFKDLTEEEIRACDGDDNPPPAFPEFGSSESDYDAVVGPFYAHWETFFTRKSYVWVEQHDTREAPNKFVRKAMEKENRAARDAARRERNEEVRTLVAFVKKRDPRVRAQRRRLEARAREVEEKARAMAAAARRAHQATVSSYQAPEWARDGDLEAELARLEMAHGAGNSDVSSSSDDDEDDGGGDNENAADASDDGDDNNKDSAAEDEDAEDQPDGGLLVCAACEKVFRTPGAKLSHDRSKRHRDRLERLRAQLERHDEALAEAKAAATVAAANDDDRSSDEADLEAEAAAVAAAEQQQQQEKKSRKKNKKKNNRNKDLLLPVPTGKAGAGADAEAEEEAEGRAQREAEEENAEKPGRTTDDVIDDQQQDDSDTPSAAAAAATTKKPRRRKDRQRQKQQEQLEQRREEAAAEAGADGGATQVCKACRQWFESKNQLFKHLKESGHAATKPGGGGGGGRTAAAEGGKKSGKRK